MQVWKELILCLVFGVGMSFSLGHAADCTDKRRTDMRIPEGLNQIDCPGKGCKSKYFSKIEHFCVNCKEVVEIEMVDGCVVHNGYVFSLFGVCFFL
jgi:hypothetical protein